MRERVNSPSKSEKKKEKKGEGRRKGEKKEEEEVRPPGFEPGSPAWQADVLPD